MKRVPLKSLFFLTKLNGVPWIIVSHKQTQHFPLFSFPNTHHKILSCFIFSDQQFSATFLRCGLDISLVHLVLNTLQGFVVLLLSSLKLF